MDKYLPYQVHARLLPWRLHACGRNTRLLRRPIVHGQLFPGSKEPALLRTATRGQEGLRDEIQQGIPHNRGGFPQDLVGGGCPQGSVHGDNPCQPDPEVPHGLQGNGFGFQGLALLKKVKPRQRRFPGQNQSRRQRRAPEFVRRRRGKYTEGRPGRRKTVVERDP